MKKVIILCAFCVSVATFFAQPIPRQSIEDSVIGWMTVYNFKEVKVGTSAEDNTVYLRADLYKSATNAALLKREIAQVANVSNIIGGDLK